MYWKGWLLPWSGRRPFKSCGICHPCLSRCSCHLLHYCCKSCFWYYSWSSHQFFSCSYLLYVIWSFVINIRKICGIQLLCCCILLCGFHYSYQFLWPDAFAGAKRLAVVMFELWHLLYIICTLREFFISTKKYYSGIFTLAIGSVFYILCSILDLHKMISILSFGWIVFIISPSNYSIILDLIAGVIPFQYHVQFYMPHGCVLLGIKPLRTSPFIGGGLFLFAWFPFILHSYRPPTSFILYCTFCLV